MKILQNFCSIFFITLALSGVLPAHTLSAQSSARNQGSVLLAHFSYGAQLPGGDLADRFGANFIPGLGLEYLTDKSNRIIGLEGSFMFGSRVKEDVIAGLRTAEGYIIGEEGSYADIQLRERGIYLGGYLGKLFGVSPKNNRSAIKVTLGAGLLQHKIRIQDDPVQKAPQLSADYKKGYDRLSNGFALRQFIGYQLMDLDGRINFYAGVDLTQGFTQTRRSYNFDTFGPDASKRFDLLVGIRIGWILPFYTGKSADDIYY